MGKEVIYLEDKKIIGLELITLGHLLKRERDRFNEEMIERLSGANSKIFCTDLSIVGFLADNREREIYQKDIEQFFFVDGSIRF